MAVKFVACFSFEDLQDDVQFSNSELRRVFLLGSAIIDSADADRTCNSFANWYSQGDNFVPGVNHEYQKAEGIVNTTIIHGMHCYYLRIRNRVMLISASSWNAPFRAKKIMAVAKDVFLR